MSIDAASKVHGSPVGGWMQVAGGGSLHTVPSSGRAPPERLAILNLYEIGVLIEIESNGPGLSLSKNRYRSLRLAVCLCR